METIILDDKLEYYIVDSIVLDGQTYTMFSCINDETNFCFRKTIEKEGVKYFSALEDKLEFEKVLIEFTKKINS